MTLTHTLLVSVIAVQMSTSDQDDAQRWQPLYSGAQDSGHLVCVTGGEIGISQRKTLKKALSSLKRIAEGREGAEILDFHNHLFRVDAVIASRSPMSRCPHWNMLIHNREHLFMVEVFAKQYLSPDKLNEEVQRFRISKGELQYRLGGSGFFVLERSENGVRQE